MLSVLLSFIQDQADRCSASLCPFIVKFKREVQTVLLRLARLAKESRMDGVVCSPQEIDIIKGEFGQDFLVVSPGIRPAWSAAQDQKRILTPGGALRKGVDYMVIGRPITKAASPSEAFLKIVDELNRAVNSSDSKNGS